jgi:DMSO/TMAO reductase YedYZ molybdopterin-dependent catalytic subunit
MAIELVSTRPLNGETPLRSLASPPTPTEDFYVRNNFDAPDIDPADWRLRFRGLVSSELELDLAELQRYRTVTRTVTLECAGNGRRTLEPAAPGTQWGLGATGTASFTGVPLADLLDGAGISPAATTLVFTGADSGEVSAGRRVRFARSLPRATACGDALVVWAMNGAPLTGNHGAPVRLIVPRYYAVASVKWLVGIEATDRAFDGYFQADRYVYREPGRQPYPVTTMRVRALLTSHRTGDVVPSGTLRVSGIAWSGDGEVTAVEVAVGSGGAWQPARVAGDRGVGVATSWQADVDLPAGTRSLRVRATDNAGHVQPERAAWNELGYGNNAAQEVALEVRDDG